MNLGSLLARFAVADLRQHRRGAWIGALIYLFLAGLLTWLGRNRLNVDGTCYVQAARHIVDGQFGLAINSWWSPAFSWLLAPGIALGFEPILWARVVQIPAGLILAFGVSRLARALHPEDQGGLAAFLLGLCAALATQVEVITPDLWQACLLTWYLVVSFSLLERPTLGGAALAGLLGGLAYLMKAYSLPFVLAHLALTYGLNQLWKRGRVPFGQAVLQLGTAFAALMVFSAPWIALISHQDHEWTINSAGRYWTAAQPVDPLEVPPITRLYAVPPGRLTGVESPHSLPLSWTPAPPFGGARTLRDEFKTLRRNLVEIPTALDRLDGVGLIKVVLLMCLALALPLRSLPEDPQRARVVWALLSLFIYLGGYALVYFETRYLWPIWGLLLAMAVAGPEALLRQVTGAGGADSAPAPAILRGRAGHGAMLVGLATLILVGVAVRTAIHLLGPSYRQEIEHRSAGAKLPAGCLVAGTDFGTGLVVTYWGHGRYLGATVSRTPETIAQELRPFGSCLLLVMRNPALAKAVEGSPAFSRIDLGCPGIEAFQYGGRQE